MSYPLLPFLLTGFFKIGLILVSEVGEACVVQGANWEVGEARETGLGMAVRDGWVGETALGWVVEEERCVKV